MVEDKFYSHLELVVESLRSGVDKLQLFTDYEKDEPPYLIIDVLDSEESVLQEKYIKISLQT